MAAFLLSPLTVLEITPRALAHFYTALTTIGRHHP